MADRKPVARQAIELAAHIKTITDSDAEIDYGALARLDELPEEEAAEVLDREIARLLFD